MAKNYLPTIFILTIACVVKKVLPHCRQQSVINSELAFGAGSHLQLLPLGKQDSHQIKGYRVLKSLKQTKAFTLCSYCLLLISPSIALPFADSKQKNSEMEAFDCQSSDLYGFWQLPMDGSASHVRQDPVFAFIIVVLLLCFGKYQFHQMEFTPLLLFEQNAECST